jgi:DNA-binding MarR family transcriptional regulator
MSGRSKLQCVAAVAPAEAFLDQHLPYLFGHASYVMNKDFDSVAKAAGLAPLEWRVLASLHDAEGLTIGELARKVVARQPTLTKAIKRMHEADLVRREDDEADLRRTRVYPTRRGRALAARLIEAAKAHEAQLMRWLTEEEIGALKRVLQEVLRRERAPLPHDLDLDTGDSHRQRG